MRRKGMHRGKVSLESTFVLFIFLSHPLPPFPFGIILALHLLPEKERRIVSEITTVSLV